MSRGKAKQGMCSYCGTIGELTRDHVIPQGLWGKAGMPSHPKPPVILACRKCNNEVKSSHDRFFEALLSVDYRVWDSGKAHEIFQATRRAVRAGKSGVAQAINNAKPVMVMKNGIAVPAFEALLPSGLVEDALITMVWGLCIYYTQRQLPDDTDFVAHNWYDAKQLDDTLLFLNLNKAQHRSIGDGSVFDCMYLRSPDNRYLSLWILRFYGTALYSIATNEPGKLGSIARSFPIRRVRQTVGDTPSAEGHL